MEKVIFQIILHGGNARSFAMEAISLAKSGEFEKAEQKLEQSGKEVTEAHQTQTELIQQEAGGKRAEVSLLLVHAQDHLMNALTIKDMAREFVDLYKQLNKSKEVKTCEASKS
jgi:PTS system cellobiose-specific IIA component